MMTMNGHKLSINIEAKITDGPTSKAPADTMVDAYFPIKAVIEPGKSKNVPLVSNSNLALSFLLITSDMYSQGNADCKTQYKLSYSFGDPTSMWELSQPQLFTGDGPLTALPPELPSIYFSNEFMKSVTISILVGWREKMADNMGQEPTQEIPAIPSRQKQR